jgi:hypothetical protein
VQLRRVARRLLPESVYSVAQEAVTHPRVATLEADVERLTFALAEHLYGPAPVEPFVGHELRIRSQHGEDGILLWLFSVIGTTDRRFVEFGVEDGRECNSANLALNWGWSGLLLEGDANGARAAQDFYTGREVTVRQAMVTPDSVGKLLAGFEDCDLLSIDIDSHDYWVWKAFAGRPRVVAVEYNASFGPTERVTLPLDPTFSYDQYFRGGVYHGASLAAFTSLAAEKGYALIGCESAGVNAFFVREDTMGDLEAATPEAAWRPARHRQGLGTIEQQRALLAGLPLVEV